MFWLPCIPPTFLYLGGGFLRRVGLGDQGSLPAHFPQQSPCPLHPLSLTGAWTGWRLAYPLLLPRTFVLEKGEWAQDGRELLPVAQSSSSSCSVRGLGSGPMACPPFFLLHVSILTSQPFCQSGELLCIPQITFLAQISIFHLSIDTKGY